MDVRIVQVNPSQDGNMYMGLFHRFKYVGNTLTRKVYFFVFKDWYGDRVRIYRRFGGRQDHLYYSTCYNQSKLISPGLRDKEDDLHLYPA